MKKNPKERKVKGYYYDLAEDIFSGFEPYRRRARIFPTIEALKDAFPNAPDELIIPCEITYSLSKTKK